MMYFHSTNELISHQFVQNKFVQEFVTVSSLKNKYSYISGVFNVYATRCLIKIIIIDIAACNLSSIPKYFLKSPLIHEKWLYEIVMTFFIYVIVSFLANGLPNVC